MSDKFFFSGDVVRSDNVLMEFADGHHIIPKWMVAHLGGTDAVITPESRERAKKVTFEEFNRRFHQAVSSSQLREAQQGIIATHLRNFFVVRKA